jgi:hypothetical protein
MALASRPKNFGLGLESHGFGPGIGSRGLGLGVSGLDLGILTVTPSLAMSLRS